ncbi:hypothetical protein FACS1894191_3780 [Clostridia bacterium]|nr:hypothetical protein FACS1894191_3780 [Clostridia bacterium]
MKTKYDYLPRERANELIKVLCDLIKIDSSNPPGREREAADYIAALLAAEGIPSEIYENAEGRSNLYARLGGGEGKPVLLLSHIDVVPAPGEWRHPPFEARIEDGIIYGRGALDTKHLTAMELMSMIWLKRDGFLPEVPIALWASADEEAGSGHGMDFVAKEYPDLTDVTATISEGGGFIIKQGALTLRTCTCGEKGTLKAKIQLEAGDHENSLDAKASTAYKTLTVLKDLTGYEAPETFTGPTRRFLEACGGVVEDSTLKRLWEYSTRDCLFIDGHELRFGGGESLTLGISYQFLHGAERSGIESLLSELLKNSGAAFETTDFADGYECEIDHPLLRELETVSGALDPGVRLLPMLALGKTDGRFIGKNVYGYSPMLGDIPFSQVLKKVHQTDECISEASLCFGAAVIFETLKRVCSRAC